jgi:hypothetical protein
MSDDVRLDWHVLDLLRTKGETVLDRRMLKTHVTERHMDVVTCLPSRGGPRRTRGLAWTTIWQQEGPRLLYLDMHGPNTTVGGLAELHAYVVEQVRTGRLPQTQMQDSP